MNITFWIVIAILLAIAFLIIIPPLWKKRVIKDSDSEQRNVNIARDRAKELKRQLQASVLTQQQFNEQYAELELSLGDDLDVMQHNDNSGSQGRWIISVIVICVPILSVVTYYLLGEPEALKKALWQQAQQSQQAQLGANPTRKDINVMIKGLVQHLKQQPDDAQGWVTLGRSYKHLKQYNLAVKALQKAYAIIGDEPELMLVYADALAMTNDGKVSGKAAELVFKSLEQIPNSVTGLWLAGMAKAESGEYAQAMQYWHKLEAILPPDSDSLRELQSLMSSVQTQAQAQNLSSSQTVLSESKPELVVSVNVQVTLNKAITAKVNPDDTVFIYAKALTGPPMPLAIVRKKVADLPLSVTLDDAMAMMPAMKLSHFKRVKIMARISKSGTAMPQKGDYVGFLDLQQLSGNTSVSIVINEEIK